MIKFLRKIKEEIIQNIINRITKKFEELEIKLFAKLDNHSIIRSNQVKLMRHLLGSIDIDDVKELKFDSENSYNSYCAGISGMYHSYMKDILRRFIKTQTEFMIKEAKTFDEFNFSRGTINGLMLIEDELIKFVNRHKENCNKKEEKFDKKKVLNEIIRD